MSDMTPAIIPKSDQINADDLLSGPITITLTDVKVKAGTEQPVSVFFAGSDKAFRPCKSMCRVMVSAWGADTSKYIGRSMTLYCDPKVKWGGLEVGGIRISHMSDIDSAITMALTVTRANKRPFTVRPLEHAHPEPAPVASHNADDAKAISECKTAKELEDMVKTLMLGAKGDKARRASIVALGNARDAELAVGVDDFRAGLDSK